MDKYLALNSLEGSVIPPSSKSHLHRALIAAAFASTPTSVSTTKLCDDCLVTLEALQALGIAIQQEQSEEKLLLKLKPCKAEEIAQTFRKNPLLIDCKESGSSLRFLLPLLCFLGIPARLTGHPRLKERPLKDLIQALASGTCTIRKQESHTSKPSWFYEVSFAEGHKPQSSFTLNAHASSQYVSGILMASAALQHPVSINLEGTIESWPYIELTIKTLEDFYPQARFTVECNKRSIHCDYSCSHRDNKTQRKYYDIESDWSAAAFWLCASALPNCTINVERLNLGSCQGDKAILKILDRWGAHVHSVPCATHHELSSLSLTCTSPCSFTWDFSHTPDLACIATLLASCACGISTFKACGRLALKESNRLEGCKHFAQSLGAQAWIEGDTLFIRGNTKLWESLSNKTLQKEEKPPVFESFSDHRFAMSAAIASLLYPQGAYINNPHCVAKSYPGFFEDLESLSAAQGRRQPCVQQP